VNVFIKQCSIIQFPIINQEGRYFQPNEKKGSEVSG